MGEMQRDVARLSGDARAAKYTNLQARGDYQSLDTGDTKPATTLPQES